jgi:hypothetical protein
MPQMTIPPRQRNYAITHPKQQQQTELQPKQQTSQNRKKVPTVMTTSSFPGQMSEQVQGTIKNPTQVTTPPPRHAETDWNSRHESKDPAPPLICSDLQAVNRLHYTLK